MNFLIAGEPKKIESVRIETPMGAIESDSGNHMVDVFTVIGIITAVYLLKRIFSGGFGKYFK